MRGCRAVARCAAAVVIVVAGVVTNVAAAHGQVVGIAPIAAGPSASASQCANGPLTSPQPCVGSNIDAVTVAIPGINGGAPTSYKNWQGGNANSNSSHWREGDFVSYRTSITGISTGVVHTLV